MKDYNEMASAVFQRRDEYLTARKKRNAIILRAGTAVCTLLLVVLIGIGVWRDLPDIPSVKPTVPTASSAQSSEVYTTMNPAHLSTGQTEQDNTEVTTGTKTDSAESNTYPDSTQTGTLPADPTEATEPTNGNDMAPNVPWEPPTEAPTEAPPAVVDPTEAPWQPQPPNVAPTDPPWVEPPTECPTDAPTQVPPTVEPTMGELYIECNGETVVAEVGDVVTVTVELQADELMKDMVAGLRYDDFSGYLKVINESSLTAYEKNALHVPNIDPDYVYVNYKYNKVGRKGIKVFVDGEYEDFDFSEKKIFFTFSFEVAKTGYTSIELVIDTMKGADGKDYYLNGEMINQGNISFDMYLTKE